MEGNDLKLKDLQPSQFYISEKKLREVETWLDPQDLSAFAPIPVKLLDGLPVMTDGHTRAVAALRAELERVPLCRDEDDMDWDMYRACVKACRQYITNYYTGGKEVTVVGKTASGSNPVVVEPGDILKINIPSGIDHEYGSTEKVTWALYNVRTGTTLANGAFVVPESV